MPNVILALTGARYESSGTTIRRFRENIARENEAIQKDLQNVLKSMFALISQDFKENETQQREVPKEKVQAPTDAG